MRCSVNAESCPHADHGLDFTPGFFIPKTFTKVGFFHPKPNTSLFFENIYFVVLPMKMKTFRGKIQETVGILVPRGMCAFAGLLCCWRLLLEVELTNEKLTGKPVPCATHSGTEVEISMGLGVANILLNASSAGI